MDRHALAILIPVIGVFFIPWLYAVVQTIAEKFGGKPEPAAETPDEAHS